MNVTKLTDGWKVIYREPEAGSASDFSMPGLDVSSWHDIPVPGDVNAVLVRNGCMPNPHYGDNGRQCGWVTAKEWWFRLEFDGATLGNEPCTDLVLDGVDGHVDLYFNGEKLGRMENAFHPHRFRIAQKLKSEGTNVLLLRFESVDRISAEGRKAGVMRTRRPEGALRELMRKPAFCFGWDWALTVPSVGIMGSVCLENYRGPRILDVSAQTFVSGRVDFKFEVNEAARESDYALMLRIRGHGAEIERRVPMFSNRAFSHMTVTIPDPKLWWPSGMGEQTLYDCEVDLLVGGEVLDRWLGRIGLRESRIIEEPFTEQAGPGISFWLEINGRKVFSKGANWVPTELWPAESTEDQYRFYLTKTAECNFNMLRVWGGGVYERDAFYDLCDELGIMIWQDFMFAGDYPIDLIRYKVMREAEYQVKRLRNRPCVVIWCGCNEQTTAWTFQGQTDADEPFDEAKHASRHADVEIYTMILRGTVSRLGLGVPYVESSPLSYEDKHNFPESGNSHLSCWKYVLFNDSDGPESFRKHFEAVCSFDSEFCIQGPCNMRSIQSFLPKEHHWPPDEMWVYHIQIGHRRLPHHEQTLRIAGGLFGKIDSLQKYIKFGQATHVEFMRAEFESARRDRPNNGGTMVWMLNDCWPTSNWSIIDYYRRPKPAYYAAKRACATLLPIVFERRENVEFFFSNDGGTLCEAKLRFGQLHLNGDCEIGRAHV